MGVIRKLTSVITVGAVDFRSDKERTALYARQTRNAVEAQRWDAKVHAASEMTARVREASARAAVAQDRLDRLRSPDPAVRAAAVDEWKREQAMKDGSS